jgi:hypothetical protein
MQKREGPHACICAGSLTPPPPSANKKNNKVGIGDFLAAKGIKKAAVQRALDALAAAGKLTAKVRVYREGHSCLFLCVCWVV